MVIRYCSRYKKTLPNGSFRSSTFRKYTRSEPRFCVLLAEDDAETFELVR